MFTSLKWIAVLLTIILVSSCSSVPDFRPSRPVEEARSFEDALSLCAEYQIEGPRTKGGAPEMVRVSVLVPWMRCFDRTLTKFPDAKSSELFVAFVRELNGRYDGASPVDAPVVDWARMNIAVRALTTYWRNPTAPQSAFSEAERDGIEKTMPMFSMRMAEEGFWAPHGKNLGDIRNPGDNWIDVELLGLKLDLGGSRWRKKPESNLSNRFSGEKLKYCTGVQEYLSEYDAAEDLSRYLQRVSAVPAQVGSQTSLRDRLSERLVDLKQRLKNQKAVLDSNPVNRELRQAKLRECL